MSPVQGKSSPVQVKEPYGNLDMVIDFRPATRSVQSACSSLPIMPVKASGSI